MTDNIPEFEQARELAHDTAGEIETFVRENPAIAVAAAVGIGCALGIIAKLLLASPPPPPKHRALQVLEDIQHRLSDLVGPAYERATHFAEDGADAVKKGVHSVQGIHLPSRVKRFFE
ncbi:hypothetical protein FEM03_03160 [Phragmitibacter flavus]|uniref:Uncharacterized protein n=1 Tax=Phragmitibacter flavus TaxID=2576071 RepID=A0A5R8KJE0_9BACT|nr:hypothetical protein [Phragmitibacter flavus]TLD72370.1 hypothetical protein FEM03_03160 [Phragmitibacter flavus]